MGDPTKWETMKLLVHKAYNQRKDMWHVSYIRSDSAILKIDMPHDIIRKVINYVKEIIND